MTKRMKVKVQVKVTDQSDVDSERVASVYYDAFSTSQHELTEESTPAFAPLISAIAEAKHGPHLRADPLTTTTTTTTTTITATATSAATATATAIATAKFTDWLHYKEQLHRLRERMGIGNYKYLCIRFGSDGWHINAGALSWEWINDSVLI
ncbi:hypothetical protein VM1G_12036 [Cytospora mali]|uniref:Uncharacterized protein n=1 Tax=Cytospora mali TaxID=578113 RepID=A0A194VIM5_CYTMA|nr:hypothetical protein VM1G_12036 [Valsa mali]